MTHLRYTDKAAKSMYGHLPVPFQHVATTLYGASHGRRIRRPDYYQQRNLLAECQWWSEERISELTEASCREFLRRAATNSPYWREAFSSAGINPSDARLEHVQNLPVLAKPVLLDSMERIVDARIAAGEQPALYVQTSGTTGTPLRILTTEACWRREYAFRDLHWSWGGLEEGDRIATIAGHPVVPFGQGKPPYWRYNLAERQLLFSSLHMSEGTLPHYIEALRRWKPVMIHGYPSALHALSRHALDTEALLEGVKAVYTHSETLTEVQRETIETACQCKVFNEYANTEMTANIVECPDGNLHVRQEHSYHEFLRIDDTPAQPGEVARVVTTGYGNPATPLIRYDTGDVAVLRSGVCSCGRPGPLVSEVIGRVDDVFVTTDNRMIGRLGHVFKDARNVREAQLIQESRSHVQVRVVKNRDFSSADEAAIKHRLRERLGATVDVSFKYLDEIPREASGKFRFAISRVARDSQDAHRGIRHA